MWEAATWENDTWEVALGKYLWESTHNTVSITYYLNYFLFEFFNLS